jgi:hypothetical protein
MREMESECQIRCDSALDINLEEEPFQVIGETLCCKPLSVLFIP